MDTNETAQAGIDRSPEAIRAFRERLGLSRRDVEISTGLSSSVVWRAEQVGRKVTDEERTKIWSFLVDYEGEHPEGKQHNVAPRGKRSPREPKPGSDHTSAIIKQAQEQLARETKLREQLQERVTELQAIVDKVHITADTHLGVARSKKRATADLIDIIQLLEPYITK